jgi:hypothetical protein
MIQAVRSALLFVQLGIGELVIIIIHWSLEFGQLVIPLSRDCSGESASSLP